jgi:tricorn protease interacting factor F2/3
MDTYRYEGSETIDVKVKNSTNAIKLNAKELSIKVAKVSLNGVEQDATVSYDKEHEEITLTFKKSVRGDAKIKLDFDGENNNKMYGFYRSEVKDGNKTDMMLSSQFEAADARAAFPSFDEPEFKSTYDLTMAVDKGLDALSNMPVKEQHTEGHKEVITFDTTPKMSSYLLYMGVGRFEYKEEKVGNVTIRMVTPPGRGAYTQLPLEYAKKAVEFYQDYFGIDYPLPKIDLIAVPDFAAGAMENWGAITFRETALLCTNDSAASTKEDVASTIAHELAHQWFGDLVTMEWWDDLWLNESFATYMSYKALDSMHPEWQVMLQYANDEQGTAFAADQLKSTHPINVKVDNPGEVDEIFDEISYQKGGSVLLMLESYVGKDAFRRGLHEYLKKNSYGNASKSDLWMAIQAASGDRNVSRIMQKWVDMPGYPMVEVSKVKDGFELRQKKFTLIGDNSNSVWPIPLTYETGEGKGKVLMDKKSMKIKTKSDWIKINSGQSGIYRASYDKDTLQKLGELVQSGKLEGLDAWGVENDLFALARSGSANIGQYLDFVNKYCTNAEYPTNQDVLQHLSWLATMCYGKPIEGDVNATIVNVGTPLLSRLGWASKQGESDIDTMLRGSVIAQLGRAGKQDVVSMAQTIFKDSFAQGRIDSNLRAAVYSIVAWNGDENTFNTFVSRYQAETDPAEKIRLIAALGKFSDPKLLDRALDLSLTGSIRLQDSHVIPSVVSVSPVGKDMIWGWTKSHWGDFVTRYGSGTHMLADFVDNMSMGYGKQLLGEVQNFFANPDNMRDDIKMSVSQLIERITVNTRFMEENRQAQEGGKQKAKAF